MRVTVTPIVIGELGTVPKGLERGIEVLKIGGRIKTIQTVVIVEIGWNTEKSPENLRRLPVTRTSVNDYQLTLMRETHHKY